MCRIPSELDASPGQRNQCERSSDDYDDISPMQEAFSTLEL